MTLRPEAGDRPQEAQTENSAAATARVLITDDYALVRDGLRRRLLGVPSLELLTHADDLAQAAPRLEAQKPDVVLLDMWLPGLAGLPAIQEVKRRCPGCKLLVLALHEDEQYMRAAFRAGADGYALKSTAAAEIVAGVESLLRGKRFISAGIARHIVSRYLQGEEPRRQGRALLQALTTRERDVLRMIAQGRRNREIAGSLLLSVKTVEKHRANLMNKLDLHNTAALTSFAVERGLLAGMDDAQQ
jgi:DNA-binding NarL/FixJ family response regulator